MDRVTLHRRNDHMAAVRLVDGWAVDAEHEWIAEGPSALLDELELALGATAERVSSSALLLSFGNAVGRYQAGPLGLLRVRSGKWTEAHYAAMLADVGSWSSALPFDANSPSALPYARTELDAPDLLYHAFVWLRQAILDQSDAPLIGALRTIIRDPHRRMTAEDRVVPVSQASRLSPRALDEICAGLRPLQRVPRGRGLGGGDFFPSEVSERFSRPTVDTAENRFVKAFVISCGFIVEAMRQRMASAPPRRAQQIVADCSLIESALAPILRHRMWEEVGLMLLFPSASTVLQRSPAYREVLRHHILLRMASKALPLDESEVVQLLAVKNIARLYELWTAFAVVNAVSTFRGPPSEAHRIESDDFSASMRSGLTARWDDGTEVAYNPTFSRNVGFHGRTWSLALRPDVCLWIASGPSKGLHVLDAKFKLKGALPDDDGDADAHAHSADLHKMHTYRDAIPAVRSAWVMYPGNTARSWRPACSEVGGVVGIGAVPVLPGTAQEQLAGLIGEMFASGGYGRPLPRSA